MSLAFSGENHEETVVNGTFSRFIGTVELYFVHLKAFIIFNKEINRQMTLEYKKINIVCSKRTFASTNLFIEFNGSPSFVFKSISVVLTDVSLK